MARAIKLTWQDGQGKRPGRWRKVYKGKAYVFDGGRGRSDMASYDAALVAWEAKKRQIDLAEDRIHEPAYERCLDQWQAILAWSLRHGDEYWVRRAEEKVTELRRRLGETKLKPLTVEDWIEYEARLRPFGLTELAVWEDRLKRSKTAPKGESVADYVKLFLAEKSAQEAAGQLSTARIYALKLHLEHFQDWVGRDTTVKEIDGPTLTRFHASLLERLSAGTWSAKTAAHYLASLKTWMAWLYDTEAVEAVPRVLRRLLITKPAPRIETFTHDEIQQLLVQASPRTKLFVLLAINVGATQVDISDLRVDEVDWEAGTITRRRSKTKNEPNVPVVHYRLWGETLELLKQERAAEGERVLLSTSGGALLADRIEDGKYKKVDCIKNSFFRLAKKTKIAKPFKLLRKTSASMLKDSPYSDVVQQFLGHAPTSLADRAYARAPRERFDEALAWLARRFRLVPSASLPDASVAYLGAQRRGRQMASSRAVVPVAAQQCRPIAGAAARPRPK